MDRIRRQFNTNVIGPLGSSKSILLPIRKQKSGDIVNISSIGGQTALPLGSLYHETKFAVEGLSESLHFELEVTGIKIKIVESGMIATDLEVVPLILLMNHQLINIRKLMGSMHNNPIPPSPPELVSEVIWTAVTDGTNQLRYRAGPDTRCSLPIVRPPMMPHLSAV